MPQGDFYFPEQDVVVERKDSADFASSTTEGRLSEQADRMVAEHEHSFVIIENDVESYFDGDSYQLKSLYNLRYGHIGDNSIIGMQTSLAVKRGIHIIYTEDSKQTCYAVRRLFERFEQSQHENSSGGHVKTADAGEVEDVQVAMLMQIDGISEEKAGKILDRFRSIATMIYSKEQGFDVKTELQDIEGIGSTLSKRVINAFQ